MTLDRLVIEQSFLLQARNCGRGERNSIANTEQCSIQSRPCAGRRAVRIQPQDSNARSPRQQFARLASIQIEQVSPPRRMYSRKPEGQRQAPRRTQAVLRLVASMALAMALG